MALLAADQPEEAAHLTLTALTSGAMVPSHHWRAREVITTIKALHLPQAEELHEAYRELRSLGEHPLRSRWPSTFRSHRNAT